MKKLQKKKIKIKIKKRPLQKAVLVPEFLNFFYSIMSFSTLPASSIK